MVCGLVMVIFVDLVNKKANLTFRDTLEICATRRDRENDPNQKGTGWGLLKFKFGRRTNQCASSYLLSPLKYPILERETRFSEWKRL